MKPERRLLKIFTIFLLIIGLFGLTACSLFSTLSSTLNNVIHPATPTPVDPAIVVAAIPDDEIIAGIQQALDDYIRAYNTGDQELLVSMIDPGNLPFKRLVTSRFSEYQSSIYAGNYTFDDFTIASIQRMPLGFVQAHLVTNDYAAYDWLFSLVDGKWLLSEPTKAQFGEPVKKETEHFVFVLYPWNESINDQIVELMEEAATTVKDVLGQLPSEKAQVEVLPGYSADPYADPNSLAYYQTGGPNEPDKIVIFCPNSFSFGWYEEETGWQPELESTLVHEYTHMAHQRAFDKAGRLLDWFSEGLAEFVSGSTRYLEIGNAIDPDRLIPLVDNTVTINQQDLGHIYLLENNVSLAYAEAESLIMFIYEKYGGIDGVWKFARAYDEFQNYDEALGSAFGIDFNTFDQQWRDWLKNDLLMR
jgi:hypothetical protein